MRLHGAERRPAAVLFSLCGAAHDRLVQLRQRHDGQRGRRRQDILDVTSTTEALGKPVHSDEKNEKTTYVTLKGIEEAGKEVERLTSEALEELNGLGKKNIFLENLLKWLVYREK